MDALYGLMNRRSVRAYRDEQVRDDQLNAILEAATYAPTGMGRQSPVMVVVQNRELIAKLSRMNAAVMGMDGDPFYGAPTVVIVFGNPNVAMTWLEDGALVMGTLMNAAFAVGVDSCWIHRARQMFETDEGKALMNAWGVPDGCVGIGNCILGYAAKPLPAPKPRKTDYIIRV